MVKNNAYIHENALMLKQYDITLIDEGISVIRPLFSALPLAKFNFRREQIKSV